MDRIAKEAIQEVDDSSFRMLEFRNTGQSEGELKKKIQKLFMKQKGNGPVCFPMKVKSIFRLRIFPYLYQVFRM